MKRVEPPSPGPPKVPEPPDELVSIAGSLSHPDVTRVGLTTTPDGDWALMVRIKPDTPIPLPEVEALVGDRHPVVYQDDLGRLPVARPAYPDLGE